MHLQQLLEAISLRRGPAIVTGPTGSGKTELCHALVQHADGGTLTALILDRVESEEGLLTRLLRAFGLVSAQLAADLPRAAKQELLDTLVRFLRGLRPIKATAVLIVDDAQNLPQAALAQIASLADLELDREPLLQIVLVGTPDLRETLRSPEGSSLDQGVAIRLELDRAPEPVESASWMYRRVSPVAAFVVALLASVLAVGITTMVYERFGF